MENLSKKEQELVAIGASIGSNCIPCIIYHIKESKNRGLSNNQIKEAIDLAQKVKKVPSEKVLNTAYAQLDELSEGLTQKTDCKSSSCKNSTCKE